MTLLSRIARALTPFRTDPAVMDLADDGLLRGPPLTASEMGQLGRQVQLQTYRERVRTMKARLEAERDAGWPAGGEAA